MNTSKRHTFEHKGYTLAKVPKDKDEHQHEACRRCVRNTTRLFTCMNLPNCKDAYFKFPNELTPKENARLVIHKLEGHT